MLPPKMMSDPNADYDKHTYTVHLKDGRTVDFVDYELMRSWWMVHAKQGLFSHVVVNDVTK